MTAAASILLVLALLAASADRENAQAVKDSNGFLIQEVRSSCQAGTALAEWPHGGL